MTLRSSVLNELNNANCLSGVPRIPSFFSIHRQNASTNQGFFSTLLASWSALNGLAAEAHVLIEGGVRLSNCIDQHAIVEAGRGLIGERLVWVGVLAQLATNHRTRFSGSCSSASGATTSALTGAP